MSAHRSSRLMLLLLLLLRAACLCRSPAFPLSFVFHKRARF